MATQARPPATDSPATEASAPAAPIAAPFAGSAYRFADRNPWQRTPEGYWVKPLYEDKALGERTLLMRIEPGTVSRPHAHEGELEQIYMVEGTFQDQSGLLRPGDYACRAPGSIHSGRTDTGCVMLLIYSRKRP